MHSWFMALAMAAISQPGPKPAEATVDSLCGAYCLYVALRALDLAPEDFQGVQQRLGPPRSDGYSMAQLAEAARGFGAHTIAVETSLENLSARKEPFACIVLMNKNHYTLLFDMDEKTVSLADPPRSYTLPLPTFAALWTRKALLIGREPLRPEETLTTGGLLIPAGLRWAALAAALAGVAWWPGIRLVRWARSRRAHKPGVLLLAAAVLGLVPGCSPQRGMDREMFPSLEVTPETHELGDLLKSEIGATLDVTTRIRNAGSRELVIQSVGTSCACTKVFLERDRLWPGATATLTARLNVGDSAEAHEAHLTIDSNDPIQPRLVLRYHWRVLNPLQARPERGVVTRLKPGEEATLGVELVARGLSLCRDCRIQGIPDSPLIALEELPAANGDVSADRQQAEPVRDHGIGNFLCKIQGDIEPQEHRQSIQFQVLCRGAEKARLVWPLEWRVSPLIEVTPRKLWLGLQPHGRSVSVKVQIRSTDGVAFRILGVGLSEPTALECARFADEPRRDHVVELTFRTGARSGIWRSTLRFKTDHAGAPRLEVPVSTVLSDASPTPVRLTWSGVA